MLLSLMAIGYSSFAQEVDPFLDDVYMSKKDESILIKKNQEKAEREYQQRLAKIEAQRKADSIEYAKITAQNHSMEIDAYNGRVDYGNGKASVYSRTSDDDNAVYGEYSSRIQRFHNGKTLVINNPQYVNVYGGGLYSNDYYYDSWYSPYSYRWYYDSYYPWYDTYPYYGYYRPSRFDYLYYNWHYGFGVAYYPWYDYYHYGYSPYYYPYYSYSAGYYDGYYSGVYNSRYVNNPHRHGNRSYQSYSSPYESYSSVRNGSYRSYSDGYNSRAVNNNGTRSYNNYNDYNRGAYNSRSYRSNSNESYRTTERSNSYNSRSNSNSSYNNNGGSSRSSSGYRRSMRN